MKSSITMQTSNYNPMRYCVIFMLLIAGYYSQGQGTGSIETSNAYPCAGSDETVAYFFVTSVGYSYALQNFTFHNVTAGIDYVIVAQNNNGHVWVKWLRPTTTAYTRIDYTQTSLSGVMTSHTAYLQIDVRSAALPLPYASKSVEFTEFQPVVLSIPTSTYTLDWYDINDVSLGAAKEINLGCKPAGVFHVIAKALENNCAIQGITETDFQVTIIDATNDEVNWVESIGYGGSGEIISHSKTFVDLAGGALQGQSKLLSANKIMTSQTIEDRFGRNSVTSLAAPIVETDFRIKNRFIRNLSGGKYGFADFGQAVDNSTPGTVGWYYSSNNTLESFVPATGYPYSAIDYYQDGTGQSRSGGGAGEALRIGAGHEIVSGTFPVVSELEDYLVRRTIAIPGITQDGSLKYEAVQKISRDNNQHYSISIVDKSGKVVMTAQAGTSDNYMLKFTNVVNSNNTDPSLSDFKKQAYFYLIEPQAIQFSGSSSVFVENLLTGITYNNISDVPKDANQNWLPGFYRIYGGANWSVTYKTYFKSIAYSFYNDAGMLVSSVSPNGLKEWMINADPVIKYLEIDKTTYKYDFKGWLLQMTEPDAGTTTYLYRKDGKIRFSENAQQAADNRFSYTHYDLFGRPFESGEYIGSQYTFSALSSQLEYSNQMLFTQDTKDWVKTYYDYADADFHTITHLPNAYMQDFVRGGVSKTENANIQTWYSYDELGRVTWMAQKPKMLPRVFVVKYTYDFSGNVLTVASLGYNLTGTMLTQFYHHYEYDADKRLIKTYTSLEETGSKKLRATYIYYLHGPLKRIELGDKLQGIDFVYNIQGWLTQINHPDAEQDPGSDTNDAFGMVLEYYEQDMNGPFSTASAVPGHLRLHGLPSDTGDMLAAHHPPLIKFASPFEEQQEQARTSTMKKYSAENPVYQQMLSTLKSEDTN
jgi:hypothetical protein